MPDYFVFGGCLRSELPFPELAEIHGRTPDWTLSIASLASLAADDGAELLSDVSHSRTCHVRLTRTETSFRYAHSCSGTFDVSADGRRIVFEPAAGGDLNTARTDFVARVLLYCVDRGAVAWLHGSAVRIGDSALAFLGPSGSGKSTLALALARAGAVHICDDTLPVEAGTTPMVWPSDHVIRLRPDSRQHLALRADAIRRESDGKFVLTRDALNSEEPSSREPGAGRARLDALYLLNPASADRSLSRDSHVTRRILAPRLAVTALLQHVKLGPVVRPEDPARLMQQLGSIARAVPVYELRVSRDWAVVDQVVSQMNAWHVSSALGIASTLAASQPSPA